MTRYRKDGRYACERERDITVIPDFLPVSKANRKLGNCWLTDQYEPAQLETMAEPNRYVCNEERWHCGCVVQACVPGGSVQLTVGINSQWRKGGWKLDPLMVSRSQGTTTVPAQRQRGSSVIPLVATLPNLLKMKCKPCAAQGGKNIHQRQAEKREEEHEHQVTPATSSILERIMFEVEGWDKIKKVYNRSKVWAHFLKHFFVFTLQTDNEDFKQRGRIPEIMQQRKSPSITLEYGFNERWLFKRIKGKVMT